MVKLANNLVLGCAMIAIAEGFSLVRKYGVEPQVLYEVMTQGLFSAPAYKGYGTMVEQKYEPPGSPITVGLKDANLIQAAADLSRVPLTAFNVYRDRLLSAVAHGDGSSRASPRASPRLRVGIACFRRGKNARRESHHSWERTWVQGRRITRPARLDQELMRQN
ncbi:MAG TPA: NAD-binding protein [Bryobacteraceae bacterium]